MTTTIDVESGTATNHYANADESAYDVHETTPLLPSPSSPRETITTPLSSPRETITAFLSSLRETITGLKISRTVWTHAACALITFILATAITVIVYRNVFVDPLIDRSRQDIRHRWELEQEEHDKVVLKWKEEIEDYQRQEVNLTAHLGVLRNETEHRIEENARLAQKALDLKERARRAAAEEKAALERQQEYERQLREEKEKRAKLKLYWSDVLADEQCLGHDRIHYRALLSNVTPDIDPVIACKDTPITINNVTYPSPERCEDVGGGNVYGHWIASNEGKCSSYWDAFKDMGCNAPGSHLRRFEAAILGVHDGQDVEKICMTTPATILDQFYEGPASCPHWVFYGNYGIWDVKDDKCA